MHPEGPKQKQLSNIRAILFDLHHTITKTRASMLALTRETTEEAGISIEHIGDSELAQAIRKTDQWAREYQIENDVDIHWGSNPEDWLEINRLLMDNLEIKNISDEMLLNFERNWKTAMKTNLESPVDGSKATLEELRNRGYILGLCTRRNDNPEQLLRKWNIHHLFSTIHWTGVPGYAKPSPFTLLKAAEDINVNPRLCAYVGNYVDADVAAARRAEMLPILTVWANPRERGLVEEDTLVIDKLEELLDIFVGSSKLM